ncbi:MAG: ferritin-like domain-containing protein [Gammaproteobacteria bacterium]
MNNLFELAYDCLVESRLEIKLEKTVTAANCILGETVGTSAVILPVIVPGRPPQPELIAPQRLPARKLSSLEGRAAMIHSFAHIEFNAVNLAWDIICRFQSMPSQFYRDWAQVAAEEASHFNLLQQRLQALGFAYGDFPAHNGLWQMAEDTAHDILLRLAVVPRILEARGLDVTPDLINRFNEIGDMETVSVLETIYQDEIGHVKIGSHWFNHVCRERKVKPEQTFRDIFRDYAPRGTSRINREARSRAGFSLTELDAICNQR